MLWKSRNRKRATGIAYRKRLAGLAALAVLALSIGIAQAARVGTSVGAMGKILYVQNAVQGVAPSDLGGSGKVYIQVSLDSTIGKSVPVGATVSFPTLSTVAVAPGAHYALKLPVTRAVRQAAARDGGAVNLVISASTPSRSSEVNEPYQLSASGVMTPHSQSPAIRFADSWRSAGGSLTSDTKPNAGPFPVACAYRVTGKQTRLGRVAQFMSSNDQGGYVSYGRTADSTFNVSDGGNGEWGLGSVSLENSSSTGNVFTKPMGANSANYMLSYFQAESGDRLPPISGNEYCTNPGVRIWTSEWEGALNSGNRVTGSDNHNGTCHTYANGSSIALDPNEQWTRDSYKAGTFGVDLGVFGIQLGAFSGYSQTVELHWQDGHKYRHYWVCSDAQGPPTQSPWVFAGPNT